MTHSFLIDSASDNQVKCTFGVKPPDDKVCEFDATSLGPCAKSNSYGFKSNSPCVFIKLNKVRRDFNLVLVHS